MTEPDAPNTGQRGRIRKPAPPAPVPAPRTPAATRRGEPAPNLSRPPTGTPGTGGAGAVATVEDAAPASRPGQRASDADVVRSTGSMAVATLISRVTGFLRIALIGAALGPAVASAFNTANTLPNLITEIVLGAVFTSLVVPVLVRAEKEDPDRGEKFIRRLLTASMLLLAVVTAISVLSAPLLTRMSLAEGGEVDVVLATAFAYLLLPQIIFYGIFSLLMAVLNTKGIFKPGAWAPVANNAVAIATLLFYMMVRPAELQDLSASHVLLLGLGTTAGVVVQAAIMIPPLRRAGVNLRPLWGIDDRIKQFAGMGVAIVAYVAVSQAGYIVTNRIASLADEAAPTIYQQAWLLLQVPYGIIGVTLLTAIMPRLSRNAADGDDRAVVRDLAVGTRLTMIALIPIVLFFTAFGQPIANALFAWGEFPPEVADITGWTLSFSAFTLIPYALVLLHLRVFYAREEAWTPTFIIFGITLVKVSLSALAPLLASQREQVVVLLGAANGFGFVAGAVIGAVLLRRTLGDLRGREILVTCAWALGSAVVGVAVSLGLDRLLEMTPLGDMGSIGFFIRVAICGVVFLAVTGLVLSRSPLPEVRTLGGIMRRVPGLRRFAPPAVPVDGAGAKDDAEADAAVPADTDAALAGTLVGGPSVPGEHAALASEGFTASPFLPPMPSEASRPTRFVPGEMVVGGRYRLLSDEGGRPGVRFWRAVDRFAADRGPASSRVPGSRPGVTERDEVALIFVDTLTAPHVGFTAPAAAERIAAAAEALRAHAGPGLAKVRHVHAGRTNVVVVADWTPGVALTSITEGTNPDAAAVAVAELADAAGRAHDADAVIGADGLDRLRVDVDGRAVLAFPAPLTDATADQDLAVTRRALEALLSGCRHVPSDIRDALDGAARDDEPAGRGARFAAALRDVAFGPDSGQIEVVAEDVADPRTPPRARRAPVTSGGRLWGSGAIVVALVIAAALFAAALFAYFNRAADSPLTPDSVRGGGQAVESALPDTPVSIAEAREWQAQNPNPQAGPDNPMLAPLAVDGNGDSAWRTSVYSTQFGDGPEALKPGVGLLLRLDDAVEADSVTVTGSPGAVVEIRSIDDAAVDAAAPADPMPLTGTTVLGRATLGAGDGDGDGDGDGTDIELDGATESRYLLVWITALPTDAATGAPAAAEIAEVSVRR